MESNSGQSHKSIFIIGMRGAGKTTMGKWLAELLSWKFLDLDTVVSEMTGVQTRELIRHFGWEEFRLREVAALRELMVTAQKFHVVSCGGGIVETEEARILLKDWHSSGIVLLVHRDMNEVAEYLLADKTRHEFPYHIQEVYDRRRPWFEECSNLSYLSPHAHHGDGIPHHFESFVSGIQNQVLPGGRAFPTSHLPPSSPSSTPPIDCIVSEPQSSV
ncbi:Shikimate dehydrogenase [Penicillium verhagenii]|nr:Shikimate dehydrogenase [Penicillium verhagenii]